MFTPREWQNDFGEKWKTKMDAGDHIFFGIAPPGSGKTLASAWLASQAIRDYGVEQVIIVVHRTTIRPSWGDAMDYFDHPVFSEFDNDSMIIDGFFGAVVTYQQIANKPNSWNKIVASKKTLIIADEPHHMADNKSWGDAMLFAFKTAYAHLLITGTPWRTDGEKIPWVTYSASGRAKYDFWYSYQQSIDDGVTKSAVFFPADAYIKKEVTKLSECVDSFWLRSILYNRDWVLNVLKKADDKLNEIRQSVPNAAGLFVGMNKDHVRWAAKLYNELIGEQPTIILSDQKNTLKRLGDFREGNSKWVFACNMISEGTDIPRLSVGVYATSITTRLYFQQWVGRFQRTKNSTIPSWCYIPKFQPIMNLARTVHKEQYVPIKNTQLHDDDFYYDVPQDDDSDDRYIPTIPSVDDDIEADVLWEESVLFNGSSTSPSQISTKETSFEIVEKRTKSYTAPKRPTSAETQLKQMRKKISALVRRVDFKTNANKKTIFLILKNWSGGRGINQLPITVLAKHEKYIETVLALETVIPIGRCYHCHKSSIPWGFACLEHEEYVVINLEDDNTDNDKNHDDNRETETESPPSQIGMTF